MGPPFLSGGVGRPENRVLVIPAEAKSRDGV